MENILKTVNLTKTYGQRNVVNNVNINIKKGDIYGFIGKNGAGKTTFMRTILGMTFPSSGVYEFFDGVEPNIARRKIGSLIESPAIYKNCTAIENMKRFSILFGGSDEENEAILEFVGLGDVKNKKAGKFSLGMRQRLGIAIAMIGNPEFLVLDEPINGLDPSGIKEIRNLILKLNQERNITFLISSHLLDELSKVATKYGIIDNGVLVEEISADELKNRCKRKLIIEVDNVEKATRVLRNLIPQEEIAIREKEIILNSHVEESGEINKLLMKNDITVTELRRKSESLEQYFMGRVGF